MDPTPQEPDDAPEAVSLSEAKQLLFGSRQVLTVIYSETDEESILGSLLAEYDTKTTERSSIQEEVALFAGSFPYLCVVMEQVNGVDLDADGVPILIKKLQDDNELNFVATQTFFIPDTETNGAVICALLTSLTDRFGQCASNNAETDFYFPMRAGHRIVVTFVTVEPIPGTFCQA